MYVYGELRDPASKIQMTSVIYVYDYEQVHQCSFCGWAFINIQQSKFVVRS